MDSGKKRVLRFGDIIKKMGNDNSPLSDDKNIVSNKPDSKPESSLDTSSTYVPDKKDFNRSNDPVKTSDSNNYGKTNFNGTNQNYPTQDMSNDWANRYSSDVSNEFLPDDSEEEDFNIFKYVSVLLRRKEIIILATIVSTIIAFFSYLQGEKYYTARSRLLFSTNPAVLIPQYGYRYYKDREKRFNTHLELLKSATVLERVSEKIGGVVSPGAIKSGLIINQGQTNGEKNDIIELTFSNPKAEVARDVVNEMCRVYVDYSREVSAQEDTRFILKLKTQIDKLRAELRVKQDALRRFKEQHGMIQLSAEANSVVGKLNTMEQALQKIKLDLFSGKEEMAAVREQIKKQHVNIVESMTYENPYRDKIASLQLELNTLSAEYGSNHYKIKNIVEQIESLKKAMKDSITNNASVKTMSKNPIRESLVQKLVDLGVNISTLEAKRVALEQMIEKMRIELKNMPTLEQEYANLQSGNKSLKQTLAMLEKKYEEAKVSRDSKESDLKILEIARTPTHVLSTKNISSVWTGMFVGFVIGIGLALLLEYLDQTLKDPSQVEKLLELPLLGAVPHIETEKTMLDDGELSKTVLEPFRALRANLKHVASTHDAKVLMICSAVKGEGKTTLSTNLALTFAMDGKKVIIVDADLRRSQIHHYLDVDKDIGLADYLSASVDLPQIIKKTRYENLFVITSGNRPSNPAELLGTYRLDQMLDEIRSYADLIIYDSPATLPVSDSIIMAPKMDACVMVVRTQWTPLKAAKQAKSQLKRIGAKMVGCILNGIPHSRGYYPYYYGYYGYYSYRYTYEDEPKKPFSLRELGLRVEASAKESLDNARLSLPHYMSNFNNFLAYISKKSFFWLLLIVFIIITGVKLYLRSENPKSNHKKKGSSGLITYHGNKSSKNVPKGNLVALNKRSSDNYGGNVDLINRKKFIEKSKIDIKDSINVLVNALSTGENNRYLKFYDPLEFKFPGGSFFEWKENLKSGALSKLIINSTVITDSISVTSVNNKFIKSTVYFKVCKENDTGSVEQTMIWKNNKQEGWRIIREKNKILKKKSK